MKNVINSVLVLLLIMIIVSCNRETKTEKFNFDNSVIEDLVVFAKSYGLVKYFHPGDRAAEIDWNSFAIYGSKQIRNKSQEIDINQSLNNLYGPFSTVYFSKVKNNIKADLNCAEKAFWQHQGLGMDSEDPSNIYYSLRINAETKESVAEEFGKIMKELSLTNINGKKIIFKARVRMKEGSKGTGHLRLKVVDQNNEILTFQAMTKNPIQNYEWDEYSLTTDLSEKSSKLLFGFSLKNKGELLIDSYELILVDKFDKESLLLKNNNKIDSYLNWSEEGLGYSLHESNNSSTNSLAIKFSDTLITKRYKKIFNDEPENSILNISRAYDVYCSLPIWLCLEEGKTQPIIDEESINKFRKELSEVTYQTSDLDFRIANVIIVFNIAQHFYPYLKEVEVRWEEVLRNALRNSFEDQTFKDHIETLEEMIASLKDGHGRIEGYSIDKGVLPIAWDIVEEKLVITNILNNDLPLEIGDIITHINGEKADVFLNEYRKRISAGTIGWLEERLKFESIVGEVGKKINISIDNKDYDLVYTDTIYNNGGRKNSYLIAYKDITEETKYMHLGKAEMIDFENHIQDLQKAKNIIFDLRSYPTVSPDVISHLLKADDTAKSWIQLPKFIYPNQKGVNTLKHGWELEAKEPYIGSKKIIFLSNAKAISYAESLLGFVKSYQLATIIGEPSAGANGNYNKTELLGDLRFVWTGMNLVQPDGVKYFAKGIQPDILVEETISGIKADKDEILEFALKYLNN